MRVPVSWLREMVDVDVGLDKLAELLDLSGTKVESIRPPREDISGVVVAEVVSISDHPNADNLTLVDVRTADGDGHVVCGAKNFAVGDRVPFAQVGAHLGPAGLDITERKIRGQASAGMLCSAAELGISRDHSGLLILPRDAELGADVVPLLGLDDAVLELEITPNRPDCMSVLGIAREVSALLGHEVRRPGVPDADRGGDTPVRVTIQDADGCPRYVARWIGGVTVAPAPAWMSTRLLAAGVRPISNVVDVTNYVMLELGQPLHAFDARQVADHEIVVRRAGPGETMRTLDGAERGLHPDDLLIADPTRPLALAGVMGGEDSEVGPDTADVILESAYFAPATVAYTSRRHLLRTEASARFERGADPELPPVAAERAAALMAALAGGTVGAEAVDEYPKPYTRPRITLRPVRTERLIGLEIGAGDQAGYLRRLGCEVEDGDPLVVEVPGYRPDLAREVDLIEEVARLAGFEGIPGTIRAGRGGGLEPDQRAEREVRRTLTAAGFSEAWTTSFMSPAELQRLSPEEGWTDEPVPIANPMNEGEETLRTTLLPGLLRGVSHNVARRAAGLALFEIANVYSGPADPLPTESKLLAGAAWGSRRAKGWVESATEWDFFAVKGALEALFARLGLSDVGWEPVHGLPFHPTRAAALSAGGSGLGVVGEVHPDVCERFDCPEGVVAFELVAEALFSGVNQRVQVGEVPRFPGLFLDLALVVDRAVPAEEVRSALREAGAPEVVSAHLFDVYAGDQVPEGRKSLAFALELRSPERTLRDQDAAAVRERILGAVAERFGGEARS